LLRAKVNRATTDSRFLRLRKADLQRRNPESCGDNKGSTQFIAEGNLPQKQVAAKKNSHKTIRRKNNLPQGNSPQKQFVTRQFTARVHIKD
jgi:hypothetical protein